MKSLRPIIMLSALLIATGAMGDMVRSRSLDDVSPPRSTSQACSEAPRAHTGMRCWRNDADERMLEALSMPGVLVRSERSGSSKENSVWIGVKLALLKSKFRKQLGVAKGILVAEVASTGPANSAGLAEGDVIVSADDKEIELPMDFTEVLSNHTPGHTIKVGLIRSGTLMHKEIVLAAKPDYPEKIFTTVDGDLIQ